MNPFSSKNHPSKVRNAAGSRSAAISSGRMPDAAPWTELTIPQEPKQDTALCSFNRPSPSCREIAFAAAENFVSTRRFDFAEHAPPADPPISSKSSTSRNFSVSTI
jgi:hypothetical protein